VHLVEEQLGHPIKQGERIYDVSDELLRALTTAYSEATASASTRLPPA
jgi:hypothetical protein